MANHKSALRRIRSNRTKQIRNRYQHQSTRTAMKKLKASENKEQALEQLPKVVSMLQKLAKKNIIHKNKAANLQSKMTKFVNNFEIS